MGALTDVRRELEQALHNVSEGCQAFSLAIDQVGVSTMVATIELKTRLLRIAHDISRSEKALYQQHEDKGYVCFFAGDHGGLTVYWMEGKELVANRHLVPGWTAVPTKDVLLAIANLLAKVDSGKSAEAVLWINSYGRQPFL